MSRFPVTGTILNSACPWASNYEDLLNLYTCTFTQALTTRTATLNGFAEDRSLHQVAFFGTENESSSINSHGYSPFPLSKYLEWIEILLTSKTLPLKTIIFSITGNLNEVEIMLRSLNLFANKLKVVIGVEMNASCPNIPGHPPPAYDRKGLESYFNLLSRFASPLLRVGLKLPPFTYIDQFNSVIFALQQVSPVPSSSTSDQSQQHPISFLTSTNTLGTGIIFSEQVEKISDGTNEIEDELKGVKFGLPNEGFGGLAGKIIHQLSLGNVSRLSNLLNTSSDISLKTISIIGVGGVEDAEGVDRMRRAGASAVACATALGRGGIAVFERMNSVPMKN